MTICFRLVSQKHGEILLNLFLVFRSGRAAQILFLEFIKDGPTNLGDECTYGGFLLLFGGIWGCGEDAGCIAVVDLTQMFHASIFFKLVLHP